MCMHACVQKLVHYSLQLLYALLQVVASLPRVLRDVESLGHEVSVLKNQMKSVRQDIEKVGLLL